LTNFIALYRGHSVSDAELVAVMAEPRLVRRFFVELLGGEPETDDSKQSPLLEVVRDE
jgi:hypothetical protein